MKIKITNKIVFSKSVNSSAAFFAAISFITIFFDFPDGTKPLAFLVIVLLFILLYLYTWNKLRNLTDVRIKIDSTTVNVKVGDIFKQDGLKVIAFNEFFDTLVDNKVIAEKSLNGQFLKNNLNIKINELDILINEHNFHMDEILERNVERHAGKSTRYKLGTIFVHEDYLLAAFSKFNQKNKAYLTMPQYLEFMINFWDNINRIYAQRSVSTTIMGSGITSITEHKNISANELLKIMLWTFRVSETRFSHPARLSVIISPDMADNINWLEIESAANGI
jgi:hypothetical protein